MAKVLAGIAVSKKNAVETFSCQSSIYHGTSNKHVYNRQQEELAQRNNM
jgi:hypothetical protein